MKEFWNEAITAKSWNKLIELAKQYNFILIGGWAAYLWTNTHKSKDIDIVVDFETLHILKSDFPLEKNERLRKYEIKLGEFDIDVYVPGYSKLSFPLDQLEKHTTSIKTIKVPSSECLLILKQGAEINRRGSIKGKKDLIDIMTLLIHSDFSVEKYNQLLIQTNQKKLMEALKQEISLFNPKDVFYLGIDFNEFSKWKKKFIKDLKSI